jgi:hypothetical protein
MLRQKGKSRREIKEILGFISNSTLNRFLRDEPLPPDRAGPGYAESKRRAAEGVRRYWAVEGAAREAARAAISAAAAAEIGQLTDREILIAGAIAYWCEGAKSKPYRVDWAAATTTVAEVADKSTASASGITSKEAAPGEGFEPPLRGPKPLVLPLDDPGLPARTTLPGRAADTPAPSPARAVRGHRAADAG